MSILIRQPSKAELGNIGEYSVFHITKELFKQHGLQLQSHIDDSLDDRRIDLRVLDHGEPIAEAEIKNTSNGYKIPVTWALSCIVQRKGEVPLIAILLGTVLTPKSKKLIDDNLYDCIQVPVQLRSWEAIHKAKKQLLRGAKGFLKGVLRIRSAMKRTATKLITKGSSSILFNPSLSVHSSVRELCKGRKCVDRCSTSGLIVVSRFFDVSSRLLTEIMTQFRGWYRGRFVSSVKLRVKSREEILKMLFSRGRKLSEILRRKEVNF